uniref:hypothetical protein n=1 Tax=Endozoicomonas sp. YOMI1 TaxID=2828739 RepID=UPI002148624F
MFPSYHELGLTPEGSSSLELPLGTDNKTPSRSLYSGRNVSRQEQIELPLLIDTFGPSIGEAPLKRKVSHIEGALLDERLKRKRLGYEDEHKHNSSIKTVEQLKDLCLERKIIIKPTLDKLIHSCPNESKVQLLSKLGIYFSHTYSTVKDTATITSILLRGEGTPNTKKNINHFLSTEDCDVKAIALSPFLKSIASICNGKGFPKAGDVD